MQGYLAVDESNHGRIDEVFAGIYSENIKDIVEDELPSKLSARKVKDLYHIIKKHELAYLLIGDEFKSEFSDSGIQVIVLSEFIKKYGNLKRILFDGELRSSVIKKVNELAKPNNVGSIKSYPHGDEKIPLIQEADTAAYHLFRHKKRKYSKYLIEPDIEDYKMILENKTFRR